MEIKVAKNDNRVLSVDANVYELCDLVKACMPKGRKTAKHKEILAKLGKQIREADLEVENLLRVEDDEIAKEKGGHHAA